jgi:hypothetical protein
LNKPWPQTKSTDERLKDQQRQHPSDRKSFLAQSSTDRKMGSNNSKEKELNEDLERIRKERIARERAERDRADKERANKEAEIRAKNIDIIEAADEGRIADVKLVLQHAPERVNNQDSVLLLLHTHTLLIMAVAQDGATALHYATVNNSLEVAKALVAAKANVDIKTNVRASCS